MQVSQGGITYIGLVLDIENVFFTSFVESIRDQSEIVDTVKYVVNENHLNSRIKHLFQ